ncbi:RCC1 domain-containing protein [Paenibacillus sp. Marseille-Q9583]
MNRRSRTHFAGKLFVWCMVILMIATTLFAYPALAAKGWSQYGKAGSEEGTNPGEFGYPVGVATDSLGNVYVADYDNNRIQKLDISTGLWVEWGKGGGAAGSALGEFNSPTGIAVDNSGNIYVADKLNHRIQKWDAVTGKWKKWGKEYNGKYVIDNGWGTAPGEFRIPSDVAVDQDGNVYVADTTNQRLQMLDAATGKWIIFGKNGQRTGSQLGEFNQPTGVAVDSKGNVYVADRDNHRIQKVKIEKNRVEDNGGNVTYDYTTKWSEWKKEGGGPGSNLGEFDEPNGVEADNQGNVYVADSNNHRIQKLNIASNKWTKWGKEYDGPDLPNNGYGSELGEFDYPTGVAIDRMGNVYVADFGNHRIQKLAKYLPLSAGQSHSVALKTDGTVWTWGGNQTGQLGLGDAGLETHRKTPTQVKKEDGTNLVALQVAAGGSHTVALDPDERVWTWGSDNNGQLGDGTSGSSRNKPYMVDSITDVIAIAAGTSHTAALKRDGTVWTWGWNGEGQLGLINTDPQVTHPKQVMLADGTTPLIAKSIFAGYDQTLAIDMDGTLWMWGSQGDNKNKFIPEKVKHSDDSDFKALSASAGSRFTVALDNEGKVWTWGYNSTEGALGNGKSDNVSEPYPLQVSGLTNVMAIDAGSMHTLALKEDGTVWAWGFNKYGQIGNLSNVNSPIPVFVRNQDGNIFHEAMAIAAGGNYADHSLAMKDDGTIVAWGNNGVGQLGNGKNVNKNYAEDVPGLTFTVTFDSQNGSEVTPLSDIARDAKLIAPDAPTRSGYTFAGWYKDTEYNNPWDFEADTVTANLILYAKWTENQTYTIAPISNQTLTELTAGYANGTQKANSITITRTGTGDLENLTAAISGTNAGSFEIAEPDVTKLDKDTPSATFTIKAKDGLEAGTYTAMIAVKATNMTDVTFTVTQVVKASSNPDPLTYTIAPISNQTLTELTAGYANGTQEIKSITITRTGTGDLENLTAAISGTDAGSFEIAEPDVTKLDKDTPSATFTIKAKDGLEAGTYTAMIAVKATNMTDAVFTVTQVIKASSNPDPIPTYTIAPIRNQSLSLLTAGYANGTQETKTITITRTGTGDLNNLYVVNSGTQAGNFEIAGPVETKLDYGTPSTTFTIKSKDGLEAGTFTTTITVKASNMTDVAFDVTQTVKAPSNPEPYPNPDPTPPVAPLTPTKEVILVDVRAGEGEVISKTPITRTTKPNGTVKDEVIFTSERAKEAVEQLKNKTDKTARIVIPDEKDKVSQVDVTLPASAVGTLSAGQANLEIYTDNVRIVIPSEALNGFDKDLYFRLVPIKQASERKAVEERAKKEEQIREIIKGQEIKILGRPMTIETNMQSRPVTLVLPLKDSLPQNEAERQVILDNLAIFVEHSDGTKELIRGELVAYKQNEMGIRFNINKFSTFTMVYMKGWKEYFVSQQQAEAGTHKPYIKGFIDGTFGPEKTVTRSQMAAMLVRNLETEYKVNGASVSSFKDTDAKHWAFQEMEIVNQVGIMQGYMDGRFGAEDGITRAEMAVIVDRWIAKQGKTKVRTDHEMIYTDLSDKHWASKAIMRIQGYGIMEGYQGNTFKPNQKLTRAEAVKILNRLFDRGPLYGVESPSFTDVPSTHWAFYEIEEAAKAHQWVKDNQGRESEK